MAKTYKRKSDRAKRAWQRESDARYARIINEYQKREQDEDSYPSHPEVDSVGEDPNDDDLPRP